MRASILPFIILACGLGCGHLTAREEVAQEVCEDHVEGPTVAPLRRLTETEIRNVLSDVFPEIAPPEFLLAKGVASDGYQNDHLALQANELVVEQLQKLAYELALAVSDYELALAVSEQDPEEDLDTWLANRLPLAFRRPVPVVEREVWLEFADSIQGDLALPIVKGILAQALVQSPDFLYRFEAGTTLSESPGVQQLDDWSIANRLSFLVWQTGPDQALREDAAAGLLQDPEVRIKQMRRMLADPRSEGPIRAFVGQWLGFNTMVGVTKDAEAYPEFNDSLWEMMREEAGRFSSDVLVSQGETYDALMDSSASWLTPELASVYGVSHPTGEGWEKVSLPAHERAGLLTQGAFLAGRSNQIHPNPVLRSVHILERVLCCEPTPPPEDIDTSPVAQEDLKGPSTNRERLEAKTSEGLCASCHQRINPIGFAFEQYDAMGRFRSHDAGFPVNPAGGIQIERREGDLQELCQNPIAFDADGSVLGAVEMATLLSGSDAYGQCFVQQFTRFASGQAMTEQSTCSARSLYEESQTKGRTLDALLESWVGARAFAQRTWEEK